MTMQPEMPQGGSQKPASGWPESVAEHLRRLQDPERLAALEDSELMDAEPDAAFDRFTRLAARWLGTPVALVSLVDDHRQFFKSAVGLAEPFRSERQTPLSYSFCQYAVSSQQPLVVADAREHPVLKDSLAVTDLAIVAYAGVPLVTSDDHVLGALCVVDTQPRPWTEEDVTILRELAALTMAEVELRFHLKTLRAFEAQRTKDHELLHSILDCMQDSVVVAGKDGNVLLTNAAARQGRPKSVIATTEDIIHYGIFTEDGSAPLKPQHSPSARAMRGELVRDQRVVTRLPGASEAYHSVNASPLRDEDGQVYAAVSVGRDITEARAAERALAQSEAVLRGVLKNLPNCAVLLFDHELRYQAADGEQLLDGVGLSSEALIGRTLSEVATTEGRDAVEPYYRAALAGKTSKFERHRGERVYAMTAAPVKIGGVVAAGLLLIYEITDHKRLEQAARAEAEQSRALSVKDELTGLFNRRGFLDLARKQLAIADGLQRPAVLFFVDLNGMKQINDQLGHEMGDAALVETAEVLRTTFRGSDVLARLGGDEFVALLLDAGEAQLRTFASRIHGEMELRNQQPDHRYQLSASVGGAVYDPAEAETIDSLLVKADALMYEQKKRRKAQL